MQIALYALVVLFCISIGVFLEHYLGPWPKLDHVELAQAIDLIDVECDGDYDKVHAMRQELWSWMEMSGMGTDHVSKELSHIIEVVTDISNRVE